jgi:hypothetical protein
MFAMNSCLFVCLFCYVLDGGDDDVDAAVPMRTILVCVVLLSCLSFLFYSNLLMYYSMQPFFLRRNYGDDDGNHPTTHGPTD